VERYRRRRTLQRYLKTLSYELYDRQAKMDVEQLEGTILARRPDLTERLMKDILERTDIVLKELDRQIEGLRARHGNELRDLRDEMATVRASLAELERQLDRAGVRAPD
jgi:chromosome segregation ATPase